MAKYHIKDDLESQQQDITLTSYVNRSAASAEELGCYKEISENNDKASVIIDNDNSDAPDLASAAAPVLIDNDNESRLTNVTKQQSNNNIVSVSPMQQSTCYTCCAWLDKRLRRRICRKKLLYKRIPILEWLPKYRQEYIVSDMVAGLTVGLTVIPQAIAYANVAALPLQYGLYSSFMACFVYTAFGSCKDVPVGPTAIAAIMTRETLEKSHLGPDFAVLLTFISGCVSLLMGLLQLGFLIDFISGPVSVGFTSAAAIIIATSQVKDILGISITGGKFIQVWKNIFEHIGETRLWDAVLGLVCMIVLLTLRKVKDIPVVRKHAKMPTVWQRSLEKFLWLVSTARNILVVVSCAIICWLLEEHLGSSPVVLTGHVKQGLPGFSLPPFHGKIGNNTLDLLDMVSVMGSGCIVIPLLSILETIAIAKAFSEGKPIDATQEMLAIGMCNVVSSFVSSIPVSGGLSRGAVNHSSGVRTTLGGVYTGFLVLVSLQFLTPYLYFIPKAALAAVIIAAVIFMVEIQVVKPMWRTKKIDLVPAVVTFLCCLFVRLEIGIVIGIGINLLFLLYGSARPSLRVNMTTSIEGLDYLVITPDRSLAFPSVEYVRSVISKQGSKQGTAVPVVIDSTHIQAADFTAAKGIKSLIEDFTRRGQPLIFYNLKPSIHTIFQGVKPIDLRCCFSEIELNDYLKEFINSPVYSISRH
ncbi:sodium-independent sulfate anion transporter [Nasonia vitripennis]|uniref:STAS domain-containing protein n=1 Tax=Nasonia vitripennis TaxID=7425 RepID=A0A7M7H842_NASVI|nr:sodium-independent sulfate anion transporter [Nasonia vitripennis]XP_031782052.1 sodium-independent sulfate anion transporter [Nasonia vitripennis]